MLITGKCNYCPGLIEFEARRIGECVTCPHCNQDTLLEARVANRTLRKQSVGWWTVLEIIGYLIFLPSFAVFGFSILGLFFGEPIVFLYAFTTLIPMLLGYSLIVATRRWKLKYLCSNCRNLLTDENAEMCAVCHLPIV